ncbi:hypothetical protein EYF80_028644 [Liparis tanakae]|uniref:Uncharacterized protein n=1 Tax=Liparis tanakae TaxID=230148 RepID=A0A4Z2H5Y2_9TELE|nr:hypothetical protein EYF80_028644 [Liparis tanakae]
MTPDGLDRVSPQPGPKREDNSVFKGGKIEGERSGRAVRRHEAQVADGGVGLEADEHGPLSGLQGGGRLAATEGPQQRRAGGGAVPHLEDRGRETRDRGHGTHGKHQKCCVHQTGQLKKSKLQSEWCSRLRVPKAKVMRRPGATVTVQ